jgi:hypothetical protein
VTYELAVTQAPHASRLNGAESADARQPFLRYTQRTWNGPRIAAAVASLAPGDFTTVWADSSGQIFQVYIPEDASGTDDILDWTPHGVWDSTTEQVLIGGRRGLTKIIGYSDVTGDWRELPMPADLGRLISGTVHYYGKIARNPITGVVYFGSSETTSKLWSLNPTTEVWARLADAPTTSSGSNGASFEWAADVERLIMYAGSPQRWCIYDPGANSWTNPFNGLGHGAHSILRYHPTHERHLLVGGTSTLNRATLVTSAGVATLVTDCPGTVSMSNGGGEAYAVAHSAGCWLVRGFNGTSNRIYAAWPNEALDDITWVDLGTAPDDALSNPTLIPGYSSDTVLIVSTSGLHAWRVPNVGTSITAGVGSATASGPSATISAGSSATIAAEVGAAAASGLAASVRLTTAIAAAVGTASASGLAAGVSAATRIAGAVAIATASGLQATLTRPTPIAATVGAADASGQAAAVRLTTAFTAGVGTADASGLPADVSISGATVISAGVATAAASGLQATIVTAATIAAGVAAAEASGLGAQIVLTTRIGAGVGAAAASGLAAGITVSTTTTIAGAVGVATASGLRASITVGTPAPPSTYLRYEVPGSSLRYEVGGTSLRIEL